MADVPEGQDADQGMPAYDDEINIVENVQIVISQHPQLTLEFTHGKLFFKEGRLVKHVTYKSTTEYDLPKDATFRRPKGY